ncbi:Plancitoxin-1, partial [Trichinella sp. T9]
LYKAPTQNTGKALIAGDANWQAYPQVTGLVDHSFGKAVEHVVALNADNKFIAYSNVPPDLPKVKTKSNSKGVLMMNPGVADEASWIVHTIPGFPKALRGYVFPPAEIQKGHLLICLTIKESQIDPIAKTLRIATPLIYHSDIPDTQMNSRPNLKKLVDGESRFVPPLTVSQEISTESAQEMYKRILVKQLKSTIKVWTTRDNILKSDCRKVGRNIKLITSPISVDGHASTLENDVSQWLVSEPGNKFCAIDKPYHKSQAKEPAMAVCIDDATIFTRFNEIAMYKRILVKRLKSTIKVWTTRDNILKSDCRKFGRSIKLITSPISVDGHASSLENDVSQWLVSEPGNKFCAIDKPYHKSQAKEPAMAVCIDDVTIFTRFNEIACSFIITLRYCRHIMQFILHIKDISLQIIKNHCSFCIDCAIELCLDVAKFQSVITRQNVCFLK